MQQEDEAGGSGLEGSLASQLEALFGAVDWAKARGVIHVAAIHGPSGCAIALGPDAPRSATDRFVLGLARAGADAIVTTGSILRSEPELVHRYAGSATGDRAWRGWRSAVLHRSDPPRLLVMTASGDLPPAHPALARGSGWIWTTPEGRARLDPPPEGFECVVGEAGARGIDAAIADLLGRDGVECVSIEAGPSAAAPLYAEEDAAVGVDELLLSRFEGTLAPAAEGPPFVPAAHRARRFGATPASRRRRVEASGPWCFERWLSARAAASARS